MNLVVMWLRALLDLAHGRTISRVSKGPARYRHSMRIKVAWAHLSLFSCWGKGKLNIDLHGQVYDDKAARDNQFDGTNGADWLKRTRCFLERVPGAQVVFRIVDGHPNAPISVNQSQSIPMVAGMGAPLEITNCHTYTYIYI